MRNLIGMVMKTFRYADNTVNVQDKTLYAGGKKLIHGWLINTKIEMIQAYLNTHAAAQKTA